MSKLPLFIDLNAAEMGRRVLRSWDLDATPHALAIGGTGSGKTYAQTLILGKIALHIPNVYIAVCDFKGGGDFEFLEGCQRFYQFTRCFDGLQAFYNVLEARQAGDCDRTVHILCFDELAAFLSSLDKKQGETARQMVGNLLMLGRSFRLHLLVGVQRPDAEYFGKARDNFSFVLALGNLSSEAKQMFFPSDLRAQMKPVYGKGAGYILLNGSTMYKVQVPRVNNIPYLHEVIRRCVD